MVKSRSLIPAVSDLLTYQYLFRKESVNLAHETHSSLMQNAEVLPYKLLLANAALPLAVLEGSRTSRFQKNFVVDIWQYLPCSGWVHYALVLGEGTLWEVTGFSQTMQHNLFAQKCISIWETECLSPGPVAKILAFADDFFSFVCANIIFFDWALELRLGVLCAFSTLSLLCEDKFLVAWEGKSEALVVWRCSIQEFSSMTNFEMRTNSVSS